MKDKILEAMNKNLIRIDGGYSFDDIANVIADVLQTENLKKIIDIAESAIECCEQDLNQDWKEEKEFIQKIKGIL